MRTNFPAGLLRVGALLCLGGVMALAAMRTARSAPGETPSAVPSAELTKLGFKFQGAASCASEKCHGMEKSTNPREDYWGNEYTMWHGRKDPHHTAYKTLANPKSKEITVKLKIANAQKSERCLNCHSTLATGPGGKDLKGKEYSAAEGVSCNSCHGPSEKYLDPHSQQGWIKQQRAKTGHADLLKTLGLYDTQPVPARADRCTSCHLAIEPDLVAAGHPQPTFEMNHFSTIYPDRHWHDPVGAFPAELWANGQVVELRDALVQVAQHAGSKSAGAAAETQNAYDQAMAHYSVLATLFDSKTVSAPESADLGASMQKLTAAVTGKDLATAASAATAAAAQAQALTDPVAKFKPDKATSAKLLSAIVALDTGKKFGPRGEEQQAYALEALGQAAGADAVSKSVAAILPKKPGEPPKPADFEKGLADVKGKIK